MNQLRREWESAEEGEASKVVEGRCNKICDAGGEILPPAQGVIFLELSRAGGKMYSMRGVRG